MATLGKKLSHLMKENYDIITDEELGTALNVDRSTINKWRHGKLRPNKKEYASKIATFFIKKNDRAQLLCLLRLPKDDSSSDEELNAHIIDFLFSNRDIITRKDVVGGPIVGRPVNNNNCFLGMQGLFDALSLFSDCLKKKVQLELELTQKRKQEQGQKPKQNQKQVPICVYLSSEYCSLLLDENANLLWNHLYEINGCRPVKIIFERWRETGRVTEILRHLMPFILEKKLELFYIPSAERFLCYNVSFLSENNCMVMTTEPAGSSGTCVSLYVDSPDFIGPMSKVMGKLKNMAQSMAKLIENEKTETTHINKLLSEEGDINALFDTLNLIYAGADGIKSLLKSCGYNYQPARRHFERITKQQEAFGNFLQGNTNMEVFLLDAIDDYIASASILIHELSFPAAALVQTDLLFLKEILDGMISSLDNYRNLQIVLARRTGLQNVAWRIKDGRLLLIHSICGKEKNCFYSENWLFIDHFMNLLENVYRGDRTIRGKANVIMALQSRIERITQIQEGNGNGK